MLRPISEQVLVCLKSVNRFLFFIIMKNGIPKNIESFEGFLSKRKVKRIGFLCFKQKITLLIDLK